MTHGEGVLSPKMDAGKTLFGFSEKATRFPGRGRGALAGLLLICAGCGDLFSSAPLGGDLAGERGTVRVVFINNTPHRVVFTTGTYDPLDQTSQPDFQQFGLRESDVHLDGDSISPVGALDCARVFSIGGPRLLSLIEANVPDAQTDDAAFVEGVEFFDTEMADGTDPVPRGRAPGLEAALGTDFPCNALLIIRFEPDDVGPSEFRVGFELIPSESHR